MHTLVYTIIPTNVVVKSQERHLHTKSQASKTYIYVSGAALVTTGTYIAY